MEDTSHYEAMCNAESASLTMQERVDRLRLAADGARPGDIAPMLAALAPESADAETADEAAEACPAEVMPRWLAGVMTCMEIWDDESWGNVARRVASLAHAWNALDEAAWVRLNLAVRRIALAEVRSIARDRDALVIDRALAWIDAGAPETDRESVRNAARVAAESAWDANSENRWLAMEAVVCSADHPDEAPSGAVVGAFRSVGKHERALCQSRVTASILDAFEKEVAARVSA